MNGSSIKDVVKEKYGEAALRVNRGGSACCGAAAASGAGCDPINPISMIFPRQIKFLRQPCSLRWGAGIRPHWRN